MIAELLVAAARTYPERTALSLGREPRRTYARLKERVARIAGGLLRTHRPGDRIAIVSSNCLEYIEVMWASWWAGLCAVPINAKLHPKEVAFILENCSVKSCFTSDDIQIEGVRLGGAEYEALASSGPVKPATTDPSAAAWLFYTSGTTGRPKGATLTHHNLLQMTLRNYADIDQPSPGDSILHIAPLSHASGLFHIAWIAKACNHVIPESRGFQESEVFDLIAAFPNTTTFGAPTILNRLAAHPGAARANVEHLRTFIYGGAPMYVEDLKRALQAFGPCLWQGYGQGETPNTISYLSKASHADIFNPRYEHVLSSVGIPRTGIEVRVADPEGKSLPAGEIGEILVKSEVTMSGYWNNPEATAKALKNGWLHTGDLGIFDEYGFLTLKDRSKDVIISGGSNIYPREVEEVLLLHPDVAEVAVVGRQSAEWGEEVVAFIVRRGSSTVAAAELDRLCLDNVARFKRPKKYLFIDALPKNNYGKVLKTELRKLAEQASIGS